MKRHFHQGNTWHFNFSLFRYELREDRQREVIRSIGHLESLKRQLLSALVPSGEQQTVDEWPITNHPQTTSPSLPTAGATRTRTHPQSLQNPPPPPRTRAPSPPPRFREATCEAAPDLTAFGNMQSVFEEVCLRSGLLLSWERISLFRIFYTF